MAFVLTVAAAQAQTYTVLHNFTDGTDGNTPRAGLSIDAAGNLYGTATFGGSSDNGTVFELVHRGSHWSYALLHTFQGGNDGAIPVTRVVFGPDGSLYGTTLSGGEFRLGTVFNLRPPVRTCLTAFCPWTESIIHSFGINGGNDDGDSPEGDVIFDPAGNLYGTTSQGGHNFGGTAYQLTPSNGAWTEAVLSYLPGVGSALSGLLLDPAGNLYGTGYLPNSGTIYELESPGWNLHIRHMFTVGLDGSDPNTALISDSAGNLYGSTEDGSPSGEGTVFEVSPGQEFWPLTTLYRFTSGDQNYGGGTYGSLVMDSAGNLYGTTHSGGAYKFGSVFKLTHSNGTWIYTSLYDFCAGGYPCADGSYPWSNVTFDRQGNLYGTASSGGTGCNFGGCGVVWEITP